MRTVVSIVHDLVLSDFNGASLRYDSTDGKVEKDRAPLRGLPAYSYSADYPTDYPHGIP